MMVAAAALATMLAVSQYNGVVASAESREMRSSKWDVGLKCAESGEVYDAWSNPNSTYERAPQSKGQCWASELQKAFTGLKLAGCARQPGNTGPSYFPFSLSEEIATANAKAINDGSRTTGPPISYRPPYEGCNGLTKGFTVSAVTWKGWEGGQQDQSGHISALTRTCTRVNTNLFR